MSSNRSAFGWLVAGAALALVYGSPALAQRGAPLYDTATETTIHGTVAEVKNVTSRAGRRGMSGIHLLVTTASGSVEVHLGPSAFAIEQKIEVAKGDVVDVVGSRVKIGEDEAVLARELRKGSATWILRDSAGRPSWRAGRGNPR
jgi:hypothetical protein